MTSPAAPPPHQDPAQHSDLNRVTIMEYVTTLVATLDRRFDTMHRDLKDSVTQRFSDADLRYQQRFDAQTKALDAALAAQKEAVQTALVAAEKATTKSETASEKRFEAVNEFRGQLSDQAGTFFPRAEAEARLLSIAEKIDDLKGFQAASIGRASAAPTVDAQIAALATDVRSLAASRDASSGSSAGRQQSWGWLLGAIGGAATLISVVVVIVNLATSK